MWAKYQRVLGTGLVSLVLLAFTACGATESLLGADPEVITASADRSIPTVPSDPTLAATPTEAAGGTTIAEPTSTAPGVPVTATPAASSAATTTTTPAPTTTATPAPTATATPAPTATPVPTATAAPRPDGPVVVGSSFADDFNGTALDQRWVVLERFGDISNSEIGCYLRDNVSVSNGLLAIRTQFDPAGCRSIGVDADYSSGMVQWRSFNYAYGTLEVRARVGGGRGPWPAIWLLGADCQPNNPIDANHPGCPWPQPGADEIDIVEFLLGDFDSINNKVHSVEGSPGCLSGIANGAENWHVYTLEWTPESLTFGVDGETTCVIDTPVLPTAKFLIINTAVGGAGGPVEDDTLPVTMLIDYVRVDS